MSAASLSQRMNSLVKKWLSWGGKLCNSASRAHELEPFVVEVVALETCTQDTFYEVMFVCGPNPQSMGFFRTWPEAEGEKAKHEPDAARLNRDDDCPYSAEVVIYTHKFEVPMGVVGEATEK